MATTQYFEETILSQDGKTTMNVEIGRSSYFSEDSIYLTVDGKSVVMNRAMAEKFVDAVFSVGRYHGFIQ